MNLRLVNVRLASKTSMKQGYPIKPGLYKTLIAVLKGAARSMTQMGALEDQKLAAASSVARNMTRELLGVEVGLAALADLGVLTKKTYPKSSGYEYTYEVNQQINPDQLQTEVLSRIAGRIPEDRMHVNDDVSNGRLRAEILLRRLLVKECFVPVE